LARGLVNLHGGSISAFSEGLKRGSEFVVRLPTSVPVRDAVPARVQEQPSAAPSPGARVLVVDDNRDAADTCALLLELSGYRVQTAYNGTRGLQLAESFRPRVILLDIGLPDINGYEVARQVRASAWGADLPLVAITGWGQEADRRRALEAGFDHHLTKPVAPEAVVSLVNSLAASPPG
jgi:CheY-like chemotaxis protein